MKKHDIAELAVMLLGIFFLVQTLPIFLFQFFSSEILSHPIEIAPIAVLMLFGFGFVFGAGSIAGLLVRRQPDGELYSSMSFTDWQTLFISVIGVITFVRGFVSLGGYATTYAQYSQGLSQTSRWPMVLSPVIQLVLGMALFIKARWLSEWWLSLQESRSMRPVAGG